jgi:hypothetical protein
LSPDTFAWAAETGWTNPFAFYFAGRGAMLGDVSADVVYAAFGWFAPASVKTMYEEGVAVAGAAAVAARMSEVHALWGRKYLSDVKGLDDIVEVCEALVDGLEGSGFPLFVGWRGAPRAKGAAGRAAQLVQILREWRGAIHLVSTTAAGLSPRDAILTNEGESQAKFFGWTEPFPDCSDLKHKHIEAEQMTNELSALALSQTLSVDRFQAFEDGIAALRAAMP